jgi:hypothetical protein
MTTTTTITTTPTATPAPLADALRVVPDAERPTVHHRSRLPFVAAGALALVVATVTTGVLVTRAAVPTESATTTPVVLPVPRTIAVGDVAHGGPGSRGDVVHVATPVVLPGRPVQGELSHGGTGSRADYVRPLVRPETPAARTADVRITDVAHGSAGSIKTAVAARD